jgi:hypothetical protein
MTLGLIFFKMKLKRAHYIVMFSQICHKRVHYIVMFFTFYKILCHLGGPHDPWTNFFKNETQNAEDKD